MTRKIAFSLDEKTYQKIMQIPPQHRSEAIRRIINQSDVENYTPTKRGRSQTTSTESETENVDRALDKYLNALYREQHREKREPVKLVLEQPKPDTIVRTEYVRPQFNSEQEVDEYLAKNDPWWKEYFDDKKRREQQQKEPESEEETEEETQSDWEW